MVGIINIPPQCENSCVFSVSDIIHLFYYTLYLKSLYWDLE